MMRRGIVRGLLLALLLVAVLPSCAPDAAQEVAISGTELAASGQEADRVLIILRHDDAAGSLTDLAALRFKEELERLGGFQVEIYAGMSLGTAEDTVYALRYGTVTMHMGAPLYDILECLKWAPLVGGLERYQALLAEGQVREMLRQESADNGALFLGTLSDQHQLLSSSRPLEALEDFGGLRIASAADRDQLVYWTALGALPVECPQSQVYIALQQNVVDAQGDVLRESMPAQLSRYQPYLYRLDHTVFSRAVYINQKFFTSLSAEEQLRVLEAVDEARRYLSALSEAQDTRILVELEAQGIPLWEIPPSLQEEINTVAYPDLVRALGEVHGEDLVGTLEEVLAA